MGRLAFLFCPGMMTKDMDGVLAYLNEQGKCGAS